MAVKTDTKITKNSLKVTLDDGWLEDLEKLILEISKAGMYQNRVFHEHPNVPHVLQELWREEVPYEQGVAALAILAHKGSIEVYEHKGNLFVAPPED